MDLQIFKNEDWEIRIIEKDGEPWFVGKDVALALGYAKPENAILNHCKKQKTLPLDSGGQKRHFKIIPESDLYRLIMKSQLESAEKFQDWVVEEVLPTIRKTGSYEINRSIPNFEDPAEAARAWAAQYEMAVEAKKKLAISEVEKQHAIETKAHINSKKVATSMATASAAVRKVDKLENEMGIGKTYRSVKSIKWLKDFLAPSRGMWTAVGKKLSKISIEMDYKVRKVDDEKYGSVNSYHVDVIEVLKRRMKLDNNMFDKYRKQD